MGKKRRGKSQGGGVSVGQNAPARPASSAPLPSRNVAGVLIVEAVNFDATVFDTNDISTIRGSSLSLLRMVDDVAEHLLLKARQCAPDRPVHLLTRGASIVELAVAAPADAAATAFLEQLADAAQTFVSGIVAQPGSAADWRSYIDLSRFTVQVATAARSDLPPLLPRNGDPLAAMLSLARTRLRIGQAQQRGFAMPLAADLVPWAGFTACAVSSGMAGVIEDAGGRVSASVARRRAFGRDARSGMVLRVLRDYDGGARLAHRIEREGWQFSQALDDLLPEPRLRREAGIHPSVSGKIALIHIDGNGFTKKRAMIADPANLAMFSKRLRAIQAAVLTALVAKAMEEASDHMIRVETLLLGGDELVVAVAASRALDWLTVMQNALVGHQIDAGWVSGASDAERTLTHATGMVLAQVKAPIRHLRDAASALVDIAKDAPNARDGFPTTILVIEGYDLPYDGVAGAVRKLYELDPIAPIGTAFAFPGGGSTDGKTPWASQLAGLRALKQLLPRSQAIRLTDLGRDSAGAPIATTAAWNRQVDDELQQLYGKEQRTDITTLIRSPALGYTESYPRMPLRHLVMLHDYLGNVA